MKKLSVYRILSFCGGFPKNSTLCRARENRDRSSSKGTSECTSEDKSSEDEFLPARVRRHAETEGEHHLTSDGTLDGTSEGTSEGTSDGTSEGSSDDTSDGETSDGTSDGTSERTSDDTSDGA